MSAPIENGGPAFPTEIGTNIDGGFQSGNERWHCPGLSIRDYFAIHSVQPGCGEIASVAGLKYSMGAVWSDEKTRLDSFDGWFNSLPLDERLELFARVKYAMADAMLKARQS